MSQSTLSPEANELLVKVTNTLKEENKACLIVGTPGVGKFATLKTLCEEHGYEMVSVFADNMSKSIEHVTKENGETCQRYCYTIPQLEEALTYAENNPNGTVVLVIDEVLRTIDTDTISFLSLLITSRTYKGRTIPSNVCIYLMGTRINPVLRPEHTVLQDHCINIRMDKPFTLELTK